MKIFKKQLLTILVVALLPLIGVGVTALVISQSALRTQIQTRINNTAQHQLGRVAAVNDQATAELNTLQFKAQLRLLLQQYEASPSVALQTSLSSSLRDILASQDTFHRIHLISPQGLVAASTDPAVIGQSYAKTAVFTAASASPTINIFFGNPSGQVDQYLAAPLSLGAQKLGIVIAEATTAPYLNITQDYTELGATGESYLMRSDTKGVAQYLTPLRFKPTAVLTKDSRPINATNDYRGHGVIITTRPIANTDWTLVTKIDTAEVDGPIVAIRNLLIFILVLTTLFAIGTAWYSSRVITRPILDFTEVVTKIRQGDLAQTVTIRANDEIGLLGSAFNEMKTNLVESRAHLEASIGSLPFGFAIINSADEIIFHNQALGELVNQSIPNDAAASRVALQTMDLAYRQSVSILDCLHESQVKRAIIERNIEVGPKYYRLLFVPVINKVEITKHPVAGSVFMMEDTSEKRALERSRDEFFSIASHELRTPLTAIRGNADIMQQYYGPQLKELDLTTTVSDIQQSAVRLIDIVNDFLDMSRLEQGKATFKSEPIDLAKVVAEVLHEYEVTGSQQKLYLKFDAPTTPLPAVIADADRVRQILINLIANAVKATSAGGITITAKPEHTTMKLSITDTGKGIPASVQHLLFHKFQQAADSILTRDDTQSTGLGLYISRLMAEGMSGKLYLAKSEVNHGTTFTLELPITNQLPAASPVGGAPIQPKGDIK